MKEQGKNIGSWRFKWGWGLSEKSYKGWVNKTRDV